MLTAFFFVMFLSGFWAGVWLRGWADRSARRSLGRPLECDGLGPGRWVPDEAEEDDAVVGR